MPDGASPELSNQIAPETEIAKNKLRESEHKDGSMSAEGLQAAVVNRERAGSISPRLVGRETETHRTHHSKVFQIQRMKEIGIKEGVGELRKNISEDPRFQKFLAEEDT